MQIGTGEVIARDTGALAPLGVITIPRMIETQTHVALKGHRTSAPQSVEKQFFERCVAQGELRCQVSGVRCQKPSQSTLRSIERGVTSGSAACCRENSSLPDLGGVARRAPGWLSPEAECLKSQSAPPPTPSSTEEGSILMSRQQSGIEPSESSLIWTAGA